MHAGKKDNKESQECPKTPTLARLHAMGLGEEIKDLTLPEPPDDEEEPFEGELYDGETNIGPMDAEEYSDDVGTGAVIASIH